MSVHLPVPDPAGVAVGAFAVDGVTVVPVLTGRALLLAALPEEALGAQLVAARAVPAAVARDAAALCHLAGLLALAVSAPSGRQGTTRQPPSRSAPGPPAASGGLLRGAFETKLNRQKTLFKNC